MRSLCWMGCLLAASLSGLHAAKGNDARPDFGRQVRPILAKHCFTCHGPDAAAREADLRLDVESSATEDRGGYAVIRPGDPEESELIVRVRSDDADLRMPPGDAGAALSQDEIATLSRWISAGGRYQTHWSFLAPQRPPVPEVANAAWCAGPIDRFVLARLEPAGLSPAAPASRENLIRRLYLDLAGTAPTPEEVERFVNDDHPAAYRRLVDRLLASPDRAERFARSWLDLARYSDTNGYEKDRPRSIWPYRDWVIQAIAADMPYDQFSIEQLAGDMLPAATNQQRVATGFHRNTMLNEEGGIDPLEYRFHAMVDRVATTGTVWMGLTTGCAQCHAHKYDPITQEDYYAMFAMLNNADEPDVVVEDASREQLTREIEADIDAAVQQLVDQHLPTRDAHFTGNVADNPIALAFVQWYNQQAAQTRRWQPLRPQSTESTMPRLSVLEDDSILASGDTTKREVYRLGFTLDESIARATAVRLEVLPDQSLPAGGPGLAFYEGRRGDFFLSELKIAFNGQNVALKDPSHSFGQISVGSGSAEAANVIDGEGSTGWSTSGAEGQANQWVASFEQPISGPGQLQVEMLFERHFAAALGRFRFSLTDGPLPVAACKLAGELSQWVAGDDPAAVEDAVYRQLQRQFVRTAPELAAHRQHLEKLQRAIPEVVRSLGMQERAPGAERLTHRHHRGEYLQPQEVIAAAVPQAFPPLEAGVPANRLELARWLVSDKNPLVGRVTANLAWREFFGTGIVDTAGDFGTQSEPPSHPELLDWLAIELRDGDWSVQRLQRRIVLSSSYRQSVASAPPADPRNRLLSVFPHRRLNAEQIRDTLLSASGLLTRRVGGPSVYPPQPASVTRLAYGSPEWEPSSGGDRFRRSIYTFSKRTAPFAAFTSFDGPTGETCLARRDRSTTPLQALTLLNDEMYLEIARGLAEATLRDLGGTSDPQAIARRMFQRLLAREPDSEELAAIVDFYHAQAAHGEPWMLVARALINTDEAITAP